jgi:dTDP-glucose 4,6-dehydratase
MEIVHGDICDAEHIWRAVDGVHVVYHLAALIGIPYSYEAPRSYVRTNVEGTLNVLNAARETGVRRVIHTSTSEVYGTARYAPIDEGHPLQAQSPYAATKVAGDKLAESYYKSFGLPVVTIRPFNTYGPRQSLRAVIPTIISQCFAGSEVRLGNLHPTRDLNYVADTVSGFVAAAEAEGIDGETIQLGSGREVTICDLLDIITTLMAVLNDATRARPRSSEVERLIADNHKAASLLSWRPQSTLEAGLAKTIEWFRRHLEVSKEAKYTV